MIVLVTSKHARNPFLRHRVYSYAFLPPDNVCERIMISVCPSAAFVCSFLHTNLVTTMFHERLEQYG